MNVLKTAAAFALLAILAACTPAFIQQQGAELAGQAGLTDSIDVQRSNRRLLSRQVQICLLSDNAGAPAGAALLRTIQMGFSGYFLAVGVAGESMDYMRAIASSPCPGASYLFFVQPVDQPVCAGTEKQCQSIASQYVITVVSTGDQSLVDRIRFSIQKSFLPFSSSDEDRLKKAFEQLALVLTDRGT